jgi:hypothetical protein
MACYYAQRASAALIISEATQVSMQGHSRDQIEGWRLITEAVRQYERGAKNAMFSTPAGGRDGRPSGPWIDTGRDHDLAFRDNGLILKICCYFSRSKLQIDMLGWFVERGFLQIGQLNGIKAVNSKVLYASITRRLGVFSTSLTAKPAHNTRFDDQ